MRFPFPKRSWQSQLNRNSSRRSRSARANLERLDARVLLSFVPGQIEQAYGFNQISFNHGSIPGHGQGQTITIIEPFNDPNILGDANIFSQTYGLPSFNSPGGPTLQVVQPNGAPVSTLRNAPQGPNGLANNTSAAVEWAHAIAPQANILLVEVPGLPNGNLDTNQMMLAAAWASGNYLDTGDAPVPSGVSVVSFGYGTTDSVPGSYDSYFTSVPFVAAAGNSGSELGYPASSPKAIAVGGTTLTTDAAGNYISENVWSYSPGGEDPNYSKSAPDVAYAATTNFGGFSTYDSWDYGAGAAGWTATTGTGVATPQVAALVAIADQGLALERFGPLTGYQALSILHDMPSFDFHQANLPGGNMGSPLANRVVYGLLQQPLTIPTANRLQPGVPFTGTVATFQDFSGPVYAGPQGTGANAAEINWGDGIWSSGEVASEGNGQYVVIGTHSYNTPGVYTVSAFISGAWIGGGAWINGMVSVSTLTPNQEFVQGLYQDFLHRSGSVAELNYWVGQLPTLGQHGVASAIARSTEALTDVVAEFYTTFLNRAPDSGGLSYWASQLQHGSTEEQVMAGFLSSTEFQARAQGLFPSLDHNHAFVAALYQVVLNREGSSAEIQSWVNALPSHGYFGVASGFVTSGEFRRGAVLTLYGSEYQYAPYGVEYPPTPQYTWQPVPTPPTFQSFIPDLLRRYRWINGPSCGPSSTELAGWVNNTSMDLLSMEIAFASGPEYFNVPRA
jgi:hypothetical protein